MENTRFTLDRLPHPAERLPLPLIFSLDTQSQTTLIYVLLVWGSTLETSLVAGPYSATQRVFLPPTKGKFLTSMGLKKTVDLLKVSFLCSNGRWLPGVWVLPNVVFSYFIEGDHVPLSEMQNIKATKHFDMSPVSRVVAQLRTFGQPVNTSHVAGDVNLFCHMSESIAEQIPGFDDNGFYCKKEHFRELFRRTSVEFTDDLFQQREDSQAMENATAFDQASYTLDKNIRFLMMPKPPDSWTGPTKEVWDLLRSESTVALPEITEIKKAFPFGQEDHVFKVICNYDGKLDVEAFVVLSMFIDAAKRLNMYNEPCGSVNLLMTMVYGENWHDLLRRRAEAQRRADEQRHRASLLAQKLDNECEFGNVDSVNDTALMAEFDRVSLAREVGPHGVEYALTPWEQAQKLVKERHRKARRTRKKPEAAAVATSKVCKKYFKQHTLADAAACCRPDDDDRDEDDDDEITTPTKQTADDDMYHEF